MKNTLTLNKISIDKYKCFDNFTIKEIKQINIITGLNNVGKTAFLEALYLGLNSSNASHFLSCIYDIFSARGFYVKEYEKLESIFKINNKITITIEDNKISIEKIKGENLSQKDKDLFLSSNNLDNQDFFSLEKLNFFKYTDSNNKNDIGLINRVEDLLNNIFEDKRYISSNNTYISSKVKNANYLKYSYEKITAIFKEEELIKSLKKIDNDVEKLNIQNNMLQIKLKSLSNYIPINELGDGFCRVAEILMSLYISKINVILIDEIESGIHYTRIKSFWKDIIIICKINNIQLFATTHSKEFIDTLSKVGDELEFNSISLINLYKDEQTVKCTIVNDTDILSDRIKLELENR